MILVWVNGQVWHYSPRQGIQEREEDDCGALGHKRDWGRGTEWVIISVYTKQGLEMSEFMVKVENKRR